MSLDAYLEAKLSALRAQDLFRDPADAGAREAVAATAERLGVRFLDASSNDYLGLAGRPAGNVSRETCPDVGAGASRLVNGGRPEHAALERALADWVGLSEALLFTSGFAANVGVVSALATEESVVISDQLNHASIIDGCRLARGQVLVVPHLDLAAIESALSAARMVPVRWVVTESYFSMDGDGPDLAALRALCDRHRAFLVVDEAHALGVFGPEGAGRCAEHGVVPDVLIGTLGKAVGSQGAFVAGSTALRTFLWNRARSFVFSTAPSPELCARTLEHVRRARQSDGARDHLLALSAALRHALVERSVPMVPGSFGPILPVLLGTAPRALAAAQTLRDAGVLAQPIRPPTVPEGTARLRLTVTARHTNDDVKRLADAVARACAE
ncbi:MAG TPA: 8-amino-7-oxononanoate synthase [Polyangiaceae bacterium]|nr:8-amino-7-oxononanoate synthase [Polyangiaceae bacterium]